MNSKTITRTIITIVVVLIVAAIILAIAGQHFYLFARVDQQEVGVRFRSGRIHEIVGPGVLLRGGTVKSMTISFEGFCSRRCTAVRIRRKFS